MSEIGQNLKKIVIKGIEAIGNSAENIAAGTKQKVEIYNLTNEKTEIFGDIGRKVYELSEQGVLFPDELKDDLQKVSEIEAALRQLKNGNDPDNAADISEPTIEPDVVSEDKDGNTSDFKAEILEYTAENDEDVPVIILDNDETESNNVRCPLSTAINDLFENMPKVDKMMDKVNSSLDDLGESLRKFSGDLDRQLNDFNEQMNDSANENRDTDKK